MVKDRCSCNESKQKETQMNRKLELFAEASDATREQLKKAEGEFLSISLDKKDAAGAINELRQRLFKSGFKYRDGAFTLQSVLKHNGGNCLSLALVFAAILEENGFETNFKVLQNPKDVMSEEYKLWTDLNSGNYFSYDNPQIPHEEDKFLPYRFAPLEHPILVVDNTELNTTNFGERGARRNDDIPDAERVVPISDTRIAANVPLDKAKQLANNSRFTTYKQQMELCRKSLSLDPNCREAWFLLGYWAKENNDNAIWSKATAKFNKLEEDWSRYQLQNYLLSGQIEDLNKALEKYPYYVRAFLHKKVLNEDNNQEKRFNLAVAAWCVAHSGCLSYQNFQEEYQEELEKFFPLEVL